jgi:hypothetical protein
MSLLEQVHESIHRVSHVIDDAEYVNNKNEYMRRRSELLGLTTAPVIMPATSTFRFAIHHNGATDDIFNHILHNFFTDTMGNVPRTSISQNAFDRLPKMKFRDVVAYKATNPLQTGTVDLETECVICKGEFNDDSDVIILPNCHHCYDIECVKQWMLMYNDTCPVCRCSHANI